MEPGVIPTNFKWILVCVPLLLYNLLNSVNSPTLPVLVEKLDGCLFAETPLRLDLVSSSCFWLANQLSTLWRICNFCSLPFFWCLFFSPRIHCSGYIFRRWQLCDDRTSLVWRVSLDGWGLGRHLVGKKKASHQCFGNTNKLQTKSRNTFNVRHN